MEEALIKALINKAILAPSSHNTQPWIFEVAEGSIRLFADSSRALPVNDPDNRELIISCGCALYNLYVAAAAMGSGMEVTDFPDPTDKSFIAEARLTGKADPTHSRLAHAIPKRRTFRKLFDGRRFENALVSRLCSAVEGDGVWLAPFIRMEQRREAINLIAEGDIALWSDPRWRRELSSWIRPPSFGDGLALPWYAVPIARAVIRNFNLGNRLCAKNRALAETSPLLAVLGTQADRAEDWLNAGRALERLLLVATDAGLQASYLNQPIQVEHLRSEVQKLCKHQGYPQILLRIGYPAEDTPPSPRRDLNDVVKRSDANGRYRGNL